MMKTCFVILSCLLFNSTIFAQSTADVQAVVTAVETFTKSADQQQVKGMKHILHADFRAILNQQFGNDGIQLIDKQTYLSLLKTKKIGGDTRQVNIELVTIQQNNAVVKTKLVGEKLVFDTYIMLVKDARNQWHVISDTPTVGVKNEG